MRRLVLIAPLAVLLLARSSEAGSYYGPQGDRHPQWSPNGTQIVFSTTRDTAPGALGAVSPLGGPDRLLPGIPNGLRSPDWTRVAFGKEIGADNWILVANVDGSDAHRIGRTDDWNAVTWSPDSKRVAIGSTDGVVVANADGSNRHAIGRGSYPAWSPNGDLIAYVGKGIHVMAPDGAADEALTGPSILPGTAPVWSPDGTRIAYLTRAGSIAVAGLDGDSRSFPIRGAPDFNRADGGVVWTHDGSTVYAPVFGPGAHGLVGVDLATGARHTLVGVDDAAFSRDGSLIAYSAGGECRDRLGIYVARPDGSDRRRLSDSCRVIGTANADVLHGDWSRVVLGLGGDDTLSADDTGYHFQGVSLFGGAGNDDLVGGRAQDILEGGPGDDLLWGGPGADVLDGGPGRDRIDGGGGGDRIHARDGERDWITCGPNGPGKTGRDIVYADAIDVVASDCDIVHRD